MEHYEKQLEQHDKRLENHGRRIGDLEVSVAVVAENIKNIKFWSRWVVGILGATFLLQFVNFVMKMGE